MAPKDDIRQVASIAKKVALTPGQQELLHDEFEYYDNLTYQEILELAKQVKEDFPNK